MIPSGISRKPRREGFPLSMLIAAGVGAVLLALLVWVLLGMSALPETTPVTTDVSVNL